MLLVVDEEHRLGHPGGDPGAVRPRATEVRLVAEHTVDAGPLPVERDRQRLVERHRVLLAAHPDAHLGLLGKEHRDRDGLLGELHPEARSAPGHREAEQWPLTWQTGVEGEPAVAVTHAGEPEDERAPHAPGRGDVKTVDGVGVKVAEVDVDRATEVVHRRLVVADLRRDDRLHDRRQGRVTRGDRVVVLEVGSLLLGREAVAVQEHGEHDVGLLEHLEAIDHQRVVVQHQRPVGLRRP